MSCCWPDFGSWVLLAHYCWLFRFAWVDISMIMIRPYWSYRNFVCVEKFCFFSIFSWILFYSFAYFVDFGINYLGLYDTCCWRIFLYFCRCIVVALVILGVEEAWRVWGRALYCFVLFLCMSSPPCFGEMLFANVFVWIMGLGPFLK